MRYLKWADTVIGVINSDYSVDFNNTVHISGVEILPPDNHWTTKEFQSFLSDRVLSSQRRDIEKILFRCGLSSYNVFAVAEKTNAVNAKDLFWVTDNADEKFENALTDVFESIFIKNIDMIGDSINTPDGCNVKRYGCYNGKYGIYKDRLHPLSGDVESEVAVYKLAKRIGVPCCRAVQTDENTVFSEFQYNFAQEQIVHFRRLFENGEKRSGNELLNLISKRPQYKNDFYKMMFLDFLTLQDDRHLSNIAMKVNLQTKQESFYPLYDNGRSLFYQDTADTMVKAAYDPKNYCTTFGYEGSYYDHVHDILSENPDNACLVDLSVTDDEVYKILKDSGFKNERLEYSAKWIRGGINCITELIHEIKTSETQTEENDLKLNM
ncbi:MAG: hypothetical protein GX109_07085 [Bacteroidales bacterium]|jgi:hypothetical protein|nr:hypothetical protein [Bacteroidales bacterium]